MSKRVSSNTTEMSYSCLTPTFTAVLFDPGINIDYTLCLEDTSHLLVGFFVYCQSFFFVCCQRADGLQSKFTGQS